MRIEDFPNELLIYLFSFIRPEDLLHGWKNLNNHINSILRSTLISIQINNNDDFKANLLSLKYFSSEIIYLKDERLSPENEIDICSLRNIRSLYLIDYSHQQSENINPRNHPYLTRFYSSSLSWSFYQRILFSQDRFSHLKSIGCPRGGSIFLLNMKHPSNITIRHLHLHSASSEIIIQFIKYLPDIHSLTIDYLYSDSSSSTLISLNNSFIRYLNIEYTLLSYIDFDQFLSCIGYIHLIELRLSFITCDFEQLTNILPKLPSLKRLQVRVHTFPSNLDLISIRLLNPWFTSLDYEYITHRCQQKRVLSLKTTSKQLD